MPDLVAAGVLDRRCVELDAFAALVAAGYRERHQGGQTESA